MDLFYKPPLQRPDECQALEENYLNCMFQKALRDRVLTNKCNMDSILWFHLECPKSVARFDNPLDFKRKIRDYIAEQRAYLDTMGAQTDEAKRVKAQYGFLGYPEDLKEAKHLQQFQETFKQYEPKPTPEFVETFESEELEREEPPEKDFTFEVKPITKQESQKQRK